MADKTLMMMFGEVRKKTLRWLDGVTEEQSHFAPPGLNNSIKWHAGHAYVVVEFLTMRALGQTPDLPEGWMEIFSWESNPKHVPEDKWPKLSDVVTRLKDQTGRLVALLGELSTEDFDKSSASQPDHTIRSAVLLGLHDEACHSGEIWLLRKMQEASTKA